MMNKQDMLAKLANERKDLEKVERIINALPDEVPGYLVIFGRFVSLNIPYDIGEFRRFRRQLGSQWRRNQAITPLFHGADGSISFYFLYKDSDLTLKIWLETDEPGATCRRVKVGTRTVKEPIYEIVCDEEGIPQ